MAGMSRRTLIRRCHADTGRPPMCWLLDARLRLARELLESSDLRVEAVPPPRVPRDVRLGPAGQGLGSGRSLSSSPVPDRSKGTRSMLMPRCAGASGLLQAGTNVTGVFGRLRHRPGTRAGRPLPGRPRETVTLGVQGRGTGGIDALLDMGTTEHARTEVAKEFEPSNRMPLPHRNRESSSP
nr:helix-turn-helix domain-containing protein [Streptomyces nojiriensis]